ncbi:long-chain-fatty-acid--CoA ligase [Desulforamulus hydrothermalis]|uniref:Putative crotonobetaine CoA ligase:carnitine CoA ligase n=1 Tax=Desulforamulus hydrothermalis Lam5 = DSM 18033 TaxID=1121428 RepID=K8DY15_9FIRM|nr:long-chain fatty acid--CoA ligase [Desulforamulus hydrothermalis]CCO07540.1 putative crotonobetaine CoA ligase:carnitine CoA ligase [Desulforamulus hydrothermalis Lam5 = DSM 18033]SHH30950.1 long-chain acyl-CoA synthetase [Desulforamulus hydrothermalis Lam5 = DSM 18033]
MTKEQLWHKHYPQGIPTQVAVPDMSLYDLLAQAARKYPDNPAIFFFDQRLTYSQLLDRVDRFATALHRLGIKKGDRVALMMPNCPQIVISYYAVARLGAVGVMVNPMFTERELTYLLTDSGTSAVICLDQLQPKIMNVLPATQVKRVVLTGFQDYLSLPPDLPATGDIGPQEDGGVILRFEQLLQQYPPAPPEVSLAAHRDLALLQYTGGTTGVIKGAMLTHRNLISNVIQTGAWLNICEEGKERFFCVLPFFHVFAMTTCMNLSVHLAAAMILIPRLEALNLLKQIQQYRPTVFQGVPSLYVAVISHPEVKKYDLSSIRCCVSGGAPLPAEVQQQFEALTGARLVEGYGLTEASPVTHCNPVAGYRVSGSIGLPMPGTEIKIVDLETGSRALPPGEIGELCIKGPQVMQGYWNMPEETGKVLRDGWLYTGDIARLDEQGFTYLVDRKKDMVISMGYNVYPREVEEILYEHPAVREAAVIGVKDRTRGEILKAFIVLKEGATARREDILKFCRRYLTPYKVPKQVEFRNELPKSAVGKILRRVLAEEEQAKQS